MPAIRITMSLGCTQDQKSTLVEELTSTFVRTCDGARERVTLIIEKVQVAEKHRSHNLSDGTKRIKQTSSTLAITVGAPAPGRRVQSALSLLEISTAHLPCLAALLP